MNTAAARLVKSVFAIPTPLVLSKRSLDLFFLRFVKGCCAFEARCAGQFVVGVQQWQSTVDGRVIEISYGGSEMGTGEDRGQTRVSQSGRGRCSGSLNHAIPAVCLLLSVVVAFAALLATVAADDVGGSSSRLEDVGDLQAILERFSLPHESLLKLKVRELKDMLRVKGASCEACVSKRDLIERIAEVKDWSTVTGSEEQNKEKDDGLTADERMTKLKESLAKSGIDPSRLHIAPKLGQNQNENQKRLEEFIRQLEEEKQGKDSTKSTRGTNSQADFQDSDKADDL